jgi:hypothetical protein
MSKVPNSPGRLGGPAARAILEREKAAAPAPATHAPGMGLAPSLPHNPVPKRNTTIRNRFIAEARANMNRTDPTGFRRTVFEAAGMTMPIKPKTNTGGRRRARSTKKRTPRRRRN